MTGPTATILAGGAPAQGAEPNWFEGEDGDPRALERLNSARCLNEAGHAKPLTPGREHTVIRHLPYFITLAEEGSFRRTAERLAISQPALTRRIQSLESELGVILFARDGRSARLTAAGRTLQNETKRILADVRTGVRRAQQVSRGEGGEIRIAVNDYALRAEVVVESFHAFRTSFPDVRMKFLPMTTETQVRALKDGDIDVGILFDAALDEVARKDVNLLKISDIRSVLVVHESHRLATKPNVCVADLRDEWLAWPSREHGRSIHDAKIAAFHAAGVSPNIALEVVSEETTVNMASANIYLGFVLEGQRVPNNVVLRRLDDIDSTLSLHAVWRRDSLQPALRPLISSLRQHIDDSGRFDARPPHTPSSGSLPSSRDRAPRIS